MQANCDVNVWFLSRRNDQISLADRIVIAVNLTISSIVGSFCYYFNYYYYSID